MTEKTYYAVVEFMDGLQVIPTSWLNQDLRSAVWPNFTNNKNYDKAVKKMIDPESTWTSHSIKKIFGTYGKQRYMSLVNVLFLYMLLFLNNIV
jgi:hypothetical protein